MNMLFECSPFAPSRAASSGCRPVRYEWYQVRPYVEADLYACLVLWARATRRAHRFVRLGAWIRQGLRLWRGQLGQAATWVYVQQGAVCGFIAVHPRHHIAGLFVDPDCQGAGIGAGLLRCVHETVGLETVDVYSLNVRARRFYEHHGFRVADISPSDADGEPYALLRMTRQNRSSPGADSILR